MLDGLKFFVIWLAFAILVISAIIPFLIWAIRSGHFSHYDYASRLALKSRIVEEDERIEEKPANGRENDNVSA